jgi:hypothetical protein
MRNSQGEIELKFLPLKWGIGEKSHVATQFVEGWLSGICLLGQCTTRKRPLASAKPKKLAKKKLL